MKHIQQYNQRNHFDIMKLRARGLSTGPSQALAEDNRIMAEHIKTLSEQIFYVAKQRDEALAQLRNLLNDHTRSYLA
jgi:hypothetical protein